MSEKIYSKDSWTSFQKGIMQPQFFILKDPVMVLGDQYKPDPGGGSKLKMFFLKIIFLQENHWPKDVLIQPKKYIF